MKLLVNKKEELVEVLIDDSDLELVGRYPIHIKKNSNTNNMYAILKINRKNVRLHRFLVATSATCIVDHINGNTLDNRRENLRVCTQAENLRNTSSRKNSSSKYLGVSWNKTLKYWVAEVRHNGKRVYCGYFTDEVRAAECRDAMAKHYHKQFARLNFPEVPGA